jgi:hypothetical protein
VVIVRSKKRKSRSWVFPRSRTYQPQERLNALALVALENGMLDKIEYEYIIEDFISKNAKRISFFK